jgi:hypothetical protein
VISNNVHLLYLHKSCVCRVLQTPLPAGYLEPADPSSTLCTGQAPVIPPSQHHPTPATFHIIIANESSS